MGSSGVDSIFVHEFTVVVSPMVMHKLFSLQIDIDALNRRSPLIVYFRGVAVSEFRGPKTYLIGFSSYLSFALIHTYPGHIIFLNGPHKQYLITVFVCHIVFHKLKVCDRICGD